MTRTVPLAEITWQFGLVLRKQAQSCLPCKGFFGRVRPQGATPAVGPGLARLHHLRAQIMTVEPNARQCASVIVIAPNRYLDMLVQYKLPEHLKRGLATGLADLGRINAVNAQLAGRPPCVRADPERVTVRDMGDCAGKS